jgi:ubiquinone biosynthesis protein UbiJ
VAAAQDRRQLELGASLTRDFMLTQAIENLLNRNLPRSPRAQELCASMAGQKVRIEARGLGWVVTAECLPTSLRLTKGGMDDANATISGSLMSLAALAGPHPEEVIRRGDVHIRGDAELAQRFRELAMLLKPDVEEELSALIGDTPAHQALRLVRAATSFGRRAASTSMRNVAEYLAHERRDLVPGAEAEDFYRNVERLREDLDRLEARTHILEQAEIDEQAR